ncbi:hypothetical protein PG999_004351 [Apiospora kogelbergensis]|uniref:HAT C-terminal dimerisation domain-containing protein n=1 Tax=Apiospora kogelbergensis TaxID=1337665 RepID=A0AAW0QZ46_9PEZI
MGNESGPVARGDGLDGAIRSLTLLLSDMKSPGLPLAVVRTGFSIGRLHEALQKVDELHHCARAADPTYTRILNHENVVLRKQLLAIETAREDSGLIRTGSLGPSKKDINANLEVIEDLIADECASLSLFGRVLDQPKEITNSVLSQLTRTLCGLDFESFVAYCKKYRIDMAIVLRSLVAAALWVLLVQSSSSTSDEASRLTTASWRGRVFALDDAISKKGSRGRSSWIRTQGIFIREIFTDQSQGDAFWICRRCDDRGTAQLFNAAATTSAAHHLRQAHRIHKEMPATSSDSSQNSPMPSDPEDDESEAPVSKRARTQATTVISRAQVQQAEELALGFIINSDQPFNIFSDSFLHHLLILHNPALCAQIAWGRTTLRERLSRCFKIKKDIIRKEMMESISRIHLAFDLWTSPNRLAIIAVSGHFLDGKGRQQQRLLALRRQLGAHTGSNLSSSLYQTVQEWGVVDRIGVVIADNASNNDTCLQEFFQILDPSIQGYEAEERRIRCYGHILNLVGPIEQFGHLDDILRFWRRKGPVGKLHNIVKWVRSSPQRSEYFQRCIEEDLDESSFTLHRESTHELELVLNNETRWNSTYLMIDRAILKRDDVEAFVIKNQLDPDFTRRIPSDDVLVAEDWKLLVELRDALEPLYRQTMRCQGWSKQGSFGCLWEVLPGMDDPSDLMYLACRLYANKFLAANADSQLPSTSPQAHSQVSWSHQDHHTRFEALPPDSRQYFRLSVMNAWKKLNEYYAKLGNSPLFAAAVILHPRLGISWLEGQWDDPEQLVWIHNAKAGLYRFWKRWYSQEEREQSGDRKANHLRDPQRDPQQVPRSQQQEMSAFDQWVYSRPARLTSNDSEIDKYLSHEIPELQRGENPVLWWLAHKGTYPTLHKLALDIFAIPAMAADYVTTRTIELAAKLCLTDRRCIWRFFQPGSIFDPQTMKLVEWTTSGTSHREREAPSGDVKTVQLCIFPTFYISKIPGSRASPGGNGHTAMSASDDLGELQLVAKGLVHHNRELGLGDEAIGGKRVKKYFLEGRSPYQNPISCLEQTCLSKRVTTSAPDDVGSVELIRDLIIVNTQSTQSSQSNDVDSRPTSPWPTQPVEPIELVATPERADSLEPVIQPSPPSQQRNRKQYSTRRGRATAPPRFKFTSKIRGLFMGRWLQAERSGTGDSGIQWTFFETIWSENPAWVNEAKAKVQALWDNEYRDLELTRGPSQEGPVAKRRKTYHTGFDDFPDECRSQLMPRIAPSLTDEYTRWVIAVQGEDHNKGVVDLISYWISKQYEYPRLSRMPLDVMTVPAMSAECERLFSTVGLMAAPLRSRLDASTIRLVQTLRSWLKAGLIDQLDNILMDEGLFYPD